MEGVARQRRVRLWRKKSDNCYQVCLKGFIVIFKPILVSRDGKIIKGNVDAELVLHAMIEYNNYNRAIIVTGDGDFHCLIRYLEENKKLLKLFIPNRNKFSSLLREFANYFIFVNQYEKRLKKI